MKFSERKGFIVVKEIQINDADHDLRTSLWNYFYNNVIENIDSYAYEGTKSIILRNFVKNIWSDILKQPLDSFKYNINLNLQLLKDFFFHCEWYVLYDFIEFYLDNYPDNETNISDDLNALLEKNVSGYRIINNKVTDIIVPEELEEISEALNSPFNEVKLHIKRALELYSDKNNPDYRNSVKESISAIESLCRIITNKPKATLGEALTLIEKNSKELIHPALKNGFNSIYGFTSDSGGIRHSLKFGDETFVSSAEARFMLISSSAFINYLIAKQNK